jgi:hypothetical protein
VPGQRKDKSQAISTFGLKTGQKIGQRYEVAGLLGRGSEGEVYAVTETETGIQRAAKIYFPHKDPRQRSIVWYARKLNALRHCPIVLQYHHTEQFAIGDRQVRCLISELAQGEQLEKWLARHRDNRIPPFMALHVLYQLVRGLEAIHILGEYHADVHSQNILIQPRGVSFDIKLIDFYDWGRPVGYKQRQDIWDTVNVFLECLGGRRFYKTLPPEIKWIAAFGRRAIILRRFGTITSLRQHLETFSWTTLSGSGR